MSAKINEHFFEYNKLKYFRGNAHLLELGSYGEKKDPIGARAYVDPQGRVRREHLVPRAVSSTPIAIDLSSLKERDLGASGSLPVFGLDLRLAASWRLQRLQQARLRIVSVSLSEGRLKGLLNQDADGARRFLAKEGSDGRIVSEVWIVMEAELATAYASTSRLEFGVGIDGIDFSAEGGAGNSGSQKVTLAPGSVLAYKLHKVKRWNKDKSAVEELEADYKGLG